ncbi:hypothetical protein BN1708_014574 [Verticillium longisporum]|uniref:Chromo domain-containing protein n=1 Tax=Verticillium longisporum TaxID=100787 RepID=A0A0G4LWZ1_VERLO|nr:hypothetical protein BN1708_014574 [Verticillium longisporum]
MGPAATLLMEVCRYLQLTLLNMMLFILIPNLGKERPNILPIQAEVTVTSSAMVRKSKATVPAPILVENDVNPSADKADKDEVMADMDDINDHGHGPVRGPSTGLEQDQRADLAADEEWEITELIGKEVIHGKVHYLVRWKATLVPEHEINAPDLIGEFEARFGAKAHTSAGSGRIAKKTRPKPTDEVLLKCRRARGRVLEQKINMKQKVVVRLRVKIQQIQRLRPMDSPATKYVNPIGVKNLGWKYYSCTRSG